MGGWCLSPCWCSCPWLTDFLTDSHPPPPPGVRARTLIRGPRGPPLTGLMSVKPVCPPAACRSRVALAPPPCSPGCAAEADGAAPWAAAAGRGPRGRPRLRSLRHRCPPPAAGLPSGPAAPPLLTGVLPAGPGAEGGRSGHLCCRRRHTCCSYCFLQGCYFCRCCSACPALSRRAGEGAGRR